MEMKISKDSVLLWAFFISLGISSFASEAHAREIRKYNRCGQVAEQRQQKTFSEPRVLFAPTSSAEVSRAPSARAGRAEESAEKRSSDASNSASTGASSQGCPAGQSWDRSMNMCMYRDLHLSSYSFVVPGFPPAN